MTTETEEYIKNEVTEFIASHNLEQYGLKSGATAQIVDTNEDYFTIRQNDKTYLIEPEEVELSLTDYSDADLITINFLDAENRKIEMVCNSTDTIGHAMNHAHIPLGWHIRDYKNPEKNLYMDNPIKENTTFIVTPPSKDDVEIEKETVNHISFTCLEDLCNRYFRLTPFNFDQLEEFTVYVEVDGVITSDRKSQLEDIVSCGSVYGEPDCDSLLNILCNEGAIEPGLWLITV